MPSITIREINAVIDRFPVTSTDFQIFVETGTYRGDTIFSMEAHFQQLHTIELSQRLYELASARRSAKIKFHCGDSTDVLPRLVPSLTHPTVFWLDGHFCHGDSAQGNKDCPLLEEISTIYELHQPYAIVIIDDARLFGVAGAEDWTEITETSILAIVKDRCMNHFHIPSQEHPTDRLVLFLDQRDKRIFS